jgi:hypothetical protein
MDEVSSVYSGIRYDTFKVRESSATSRPVRTAGLPTTPRGVSEAAGGSFGHGDDLFQPLDPVIGEGGHGIVFAVVDGQTALTCRSTVRGVLALTEYLGDVRNGEHVCDGGHGQAAR